MANPFLVLGGIAVGIITAAFGILQVPGWVASAQDASAQNDVAQVSILQSASLSQTGEVLNEAGVLAPPAELGVKVSTQAGADDLTVLTDDTDPKVYAVAVKSESGKTFLRVDGGDIIEVAAAPADYDAATKATPVVTP